LPLSKRARIEIYLPERRGARYRRLREAIENEFLHTFGGCTVIKDTKGLYKGADREADVDRMSLVYADAPLDLDKNLQALSRYTDALREAAREATQEESILVVVQEIYHSL
jgi:hypothetical protein